MTTTFFIGSLVAIFAMIGTKILESHVGRFSFVSSFFRRTDDIIYSFIDWCVFKYNRYKKISKIFIFEFLPAYIYELLVKLKDYVAKKYYLAGDQIRGKRILKNKGSVSNFLKNISEEAPEKKDSIM